MNQEVKTTPLHAWHRDHGANMAIFGGYEMPLWYPTGARREHCTVLTHAGLFDTSHMACILIEGPAAYELLQHCFSKDLDACIGAKKTPLEDGRCAYGIFLNEEGETIDDAIVYRLHREQYMVIVNAGMGGTIAGHLAAHRGNRESTVTDLTDRIGKIDIQGPLAGTILKKVIQRPETVFDRMPYFSFKGHFDARSPLAEAVRLNDGTPLLLSRTGYTGEFGFEIFLDPAHLVALWETIMDRGETAGLVACGLAARDSLRAGAVLPLSHQDIGPWPFLNNPWPFALPYAPDRTGFTKAFIGAEALLHIADPEYTHAYAGFDLRKVSTHDTAVVVDSDGVEIGTVLTCATDMGIDRVDDRIFSITSPDKPDSFKPRGLCCGFIKVRKELPNGTVVQLRDNKRSVKVMITDDIRPDRTARRALKDMVDDG